MNWSTETAAAAVKGQKRGILTEKNVLIFSIFESKWGSGRKYLKNERAASPSPSEGGDVPGGVRLGVVVCW